LDKDLGLALREERGRRDVRIDLAPLLGPVGADLVEPLTTPALNALGQVTSAVTSAVAAAMSRALKAA
jgi:hypothetical protein